MILNVFSTDLLTEFRRVPTKDRQISLPRYLVQSKVGNVRTMVPTSPTMRAYHGLMREYSNHSPTILLLTASKRAFENYWRNTCSFRYLLVSVSLVELFCAAQLSCSLTNCAESNSISTVRRISKEWCTHVDLAHLVTLRLLNMYPILQKPTSCPVLEKRLLSSSDSLP